MLLDSQFYLDQQKLALANAALETVREVVRYSDNFSVLKTCSSYQLEATAAYWQDWQLYYDQWNKFQDQRAYVSFLEKCICKKNARCADLVDIVEFLLEHNFTSLLFNGIKSFYYTKIYINVHWPEFGHCFAIFHEELNCSSGFSKEGPGTEPLADLLNSYFDKNDVIFDPWLWCTCPVCDYIKYLERVDAFGVTSSFCGKVETANTIMIGEGPLTGTTQGFPGFERLANSLMDYHFEYLLKISRGEPIKPFMSSTPEQIRVYTNQICEMWYKTSYLEEFQRSVIASVEEAERIRSIYRDFVLS